MGSGHVMMMPSLSPVSEIPPSTPVVVVAYFSEIRGTAAVIVAMGNLNAVLMVSPSIVTALLKSMNAMDVVSWKRHLADSAANAVKASGPVI